MTYFSVKLTEVEYARYVRNYAQKHFSGFAHGPDNEANLLRFKVESELCFTKQKIQVRTCGQFTSEALK